MIIFDLEALADCEHRRHFVERPDDVKYIYTDSIPHGNGCILKGDFYTSSGEKWKPDWKSFYEACDQDKPIEPVLYLFSGLATAHQVQIWSGRCESVREKTINWFLDKWFLGSFQKPIKTWINQNLKMRPIGDYTPDNQLKEKWLDEALAQGKTIDYVFDSDKKSIEMWRRRGIFVFNCAQNDEEF